MKRHGLGILAGGLLTVAGLTAASPPSPPAQTILFIGNSFTFGALSPVWKYRADTVADLNHGGVGGVPALFKAFTEEAGLDYSVSLETSPGKTLAWHLDNKREVIDRAWDHVVMQQYSVLDPDNPGDPATTIRDVGRLDRMFAARNPKVEISLTSTWSRPDQTYLKTGHWYGKPISAMALDIRRGYDQAAAAAPHVDQVNPVGQAFNCAISAGVADPNPYDGTDFGKIGLWAWDHYHASRFGYYLEALSVFIDVTGKDPRAFGPHEQVAEELGFSPDVAVELQRIAWNTTHGLACDKDAITLPKVDAQH